MTRPDRIAGPSDAPSRPDAPSFDAVVLAGGAPLPSHLLPDLIRVLDAASFSVAADAGLHHAHRVGREVDLLIGDLDSVGAEALERARRSGSEVRAHPPDKDATDLDLALTAVRERWAGPAEPRVLVVGGHGGRTDHLLANVLLLASEDHASLRLSAWLGADVVHVVRAAVTLSGPVGSTVSLLALHGPATGITTTGLRYPLTDATLDAGSSRGVSNVLEASDASVRVGQGVVIAIQPDAGPDTEPDVRPSGWTDPSSLPENGAPA